MEREVLAALRAFDAEQTTPFDALLQLRDLALRLRDGSTEEGGS